MRSSSSIHVRCQYFRRKDYTTHLDSRWNHTVGSALPATNELAEYKLRDHSLNFGDEQVSQVRYLFNPTPTTRSLYVTGKLKECGMINY